MRTKIIAIISFLFISVQAKAMMFIEPLYTYIDSGTNKVTQGNTTTTDIKGYSWALKLGWSNAGFSIGAVAKRGVIEKEYPAWVFRYWTTEYGAFIDYSLPIMLSFSVTYLQRPTQHSPDTGYSGLTSSTLGFGVSYRIVSFVRLQVNYEMSILPKLVWNDTVHDLPHSGVTENSTNAITFSLGVPIPLGF